MGSSCSSPPPSPSSGPTRRGPTRYTEVWQTPLRVELGGLLHLDHLSLQTWVNDALMTVFFLLVGVEIKREVVHGELRDPRAVALPVVAALGGMIVPAAIYAGLNAGGAGGDGWAVPMATDIAFAVGVVTLAGKRVPLAAKIFLLTLAVADDIGAIVVIAVFYTGALSWGWFACALVSLAGIFVLRRGDVQSLAPYLAVGRLRLAGPARVGRARHAGRRGARAAHPGLAAAVAPAVPARGPQDPQQRRGRLLRPGADPGGVRRERAAHRRGVAPRHVEHQPARTARAGAVALGRLRRRARLRPRQRRRVAVGRRHRRHRLRPRDRRACCSASSSARPSACSASPPWP